MGKIAYKDIMILLVEDDEGHAELIKECLKETGVSNPIRRFRDGQEIIDYLFGAEEVKILMNSVSGAEVPLIIKFSLRGYGIDELAELRIKNRPGFIEVLIQRVRFILHEDVYPAET